MAVLTGPNPIERPGPITLRYGMFQALGIQDGWDPHWGDGGIVITDELCDDPNPYTVACTDTLAAKTFTTMTNIPGTPFAVYAGIVCGSVGFSEAEFQTQVTNRLLAGEQGVVEQVFSRQLNGQSRGLSGSGAAIVVPNSATPTTADYVAALEENLYATYGPRGVIHATIQFGERMKADHLIEPDGDIFNGTGVWRTALGTTVSIGNYAGYSPVDVAPVANHDWVYITGQTWIWRNPEPFVSTLAGSLNRTTNQVTILAEREYVVTYECNAYAVDVTY